MTKKKSIIRLAGVASLILGVDQLTAAPVGARPGDVLTPVQVPAAVPVPTAVPQRTLQIPVPLQLPQLNWHLRPEAAPVIPANSEVLLFVHGMDSRAEEADDITNALFAALPTIPKAPVLPALPPIAATVPLAMTNFSGPDTSCKNKDVTVNGQRTAVVPPLYFALNAPHQLLDMTPSPGIPAIGPFNVPAAHNMGANEGRLIPALRSVAAAAQPLSSLKLAAIRFASGDPVLGNAYADLSVTGRRSFASFRQALPAEAYCQSLVGQQPAPLTAAQIVTGCHAALDRAYRVANYLRTGERGDTPALQAAKMTERAALGWIAVSGEDDAPHRPVNVPSSDFPQFDITVMVPTPFGPASGGGPVVPVHTRYTIAQSQASGRNLVVISVDLPTSGYADNLSYKLVSPLEMIGAPKVTRSPLPIPLPPPLDALFGPFLGFPPGTGIIPPFAPIPDFGATGLTPLLDFIEQFYVNFVSTLDQAVPFKSHIAAAMGGSLGGNMTFRMGRRTDIPWIPRFVVWSPASIWDSLGGGADILKHQGPRGAWLSASQAMNQPTVSDRAAFFGSWDKPIVPIIIPAAQSDTWTSDYYQCKKSSVAGARLDRQETYDPMFLAWHWRLGGEQLLFSQSNPDRNNQPLYKSNFKPMLLSCGVEDHVPYNDICPATQNTAKNMLTPGKTLFLGQTGHSLDNERPDFFARQIIGFLGL